MHPTGRSLLRCLAAMAIAVGVAAPAPATTLVRADLEDLTANNDRVVVGEVLDAHSYWNDEGTFILTDVRLSVLEAVKGEVSGEELTVTIMGGEVGDLTVQIVGGAELVPGNAYVLFLNREDLPGAPAVRTVRDHSQGVFDLVDAGGELRAISQASRHPLVPDARGRFDAPGGVQGLSLDAMIQSIRDIAGRRPSGARRR